MTSAQAHGCLACDLAFGTRELGGGLIHETRGWRAAAFAARARARLDEASRRHG